MKTSNKLLLVFFLAMFFSAASLMVYAKSHMVVGKEGMEEYHYGEDAIVIERTLLDNLTISNLEMGDNFKYIIDPTRTGVTVKGDSAFVSKLTVVHDNQFQILTGGVGHNFNWPDNLLVVVGVKNLDKLDLDINGNARVTANQPLEYDSIKMYMEGNSKFLADLTVNNLEVKSNGNSGLTLNGNTIDLKAYSNGNSKLNFENCEISSAKLDLNGNAKFYGDTVGSLTGHANGNAKVTFNEVTGNQNTSANGNARFTIRN